tara:strand:+ start:2497 stop:2634 length:138 start_codon:yes stop_codon:yes gene_type:complete
MDIALVGAVHKENTVSEGMIHIALATVTILWKNPLKVKKLPMIYG